MIHKYVQVLWNNCTKFEEEEESITSSLYLKMFQVLKFATTIYDKIVYEPPNSERGTSGHHIVKIFHQVHKQH